MTRSRPRSCAWSTPRGAILVDPAFIDLDTQYVPIDQVGWLVHERLLALGAVSVIAVAAVLLAP